MNADVVVLTHLNMKLTEMEETNKKLQTEVETNNEKIAQVRMHVLKMKLRTIFIGSILFLLFYLYQALDF